MNRSKRRGSWLAGLVIGTASLSLLGAQSTARNDRAVAQRGQVAPNQVLTITASQLAARAPLYRDKVVRIKSHLAEALGTHLMQLSDQRGGNTDLLVLVPVLRPYALGEGLLDQASGVPVTVEGRVRLFDRRQFEADYDWFSVNLFWRPEQIAAWEGRPVVIAQSVRTAAGHELVDAQASGYATGDQAPRQGGNEQVSTMRLDRPINELRTIFTIRDLDRLLRMRVLLEDVQVQRVLNRRWVMVGTPGEKQVLVQLPRRHPPVRLGDHIEVSGVIRQVPGSPIVLGLTEEQLRLAERPEIYVYADDIER